MKKLKEKNGITLITLVITIIVLLILASISVSMINGNNGIIKNAISAKENSEISEEKEIVDISAAQAIGKDKYGNLTKIGIETAINQNAPDRKKKKY